jgi:hypothetical protein
VVKADYAAYGTEECTEVINELNVLAVLRYAMGRLDAAEPMLRKVMNTQVYNRYSLQLHDHDDTMVYSQRAHSYNGVQSMSLMCWRCFATPSAAWTPPSPCYAR